MLDLILAQQPHAIALEEVTAATLAQLLADPRIQALYYSSDSTGATFAQTYGVVVLVDKQVSSEVAFSVVKLPGPMKRSMIYASFKLNGSIPVNFGAVHLESPTGGMSDIRTAHDNQLAHVLPILSKDCPNSFLAGDFNFNASEPVHWERRQLAKNGFLDLWSTLYPSDPGYTVPESLRYPANRFDHVIASTSAALEPRDAHIIGTEVIGEWKGQDLCPSDHRGLVVSMNVLDGGNWMQDMLEQDLKRIESEKSK